MAVRARLGDYTRPGFGDGDFAGETGSPLTHSSGQVGYPITYGTLRRGRRVEMLLAMSIGDSNGCPAYAILTRCVLPTGEGYANVVGVATL